VSPYVDKDIYIAQPQGFKGLVPPGKCIKLHKSLYGLKQASNLYWRRLQGWMLKDGFTQIDDEGTLFRKNGPNGESSLQPGYRLPFRLEAL